ncbi:GNAT family N-acetyltransferase [Arthrobacter sp. SW1]|uniref:GNAT family N-acetyltransferase n=1 Tax=Arthrobacter sp. SW1 TaxID=1920889 RepID=UPI000877D583|nr:GNAT family N-acetyltransferase [Arthrobacter sp. SW1]OFI37618.1 GNAT family N-acetyltransferase [Arthrobacter sp. SW1]
MIDISLDDPARDDVRQLLEEHLADMYATSPAESVHALDHSALSGPDITFWTAREDGVLLACGALKELPAAENGTREGELKSMRTAVGARGRGIAGLLLATITDEARSRGFARLCLETGSEDYFAAARRLYLRHGFTECPPFADYTLDPNSVFMSLDLAPAAVS